MDVFPEPADLLPHREPFLFVDRIVACQPGKWLTAERALRPEEPFFAGHFPGEPIMPGVLVTEALAQASGLLLGLGKIAEGQAPDGGLFYLASNRLKFLSPARPGETLELEIELERSLENLASFRVRARANRRVVAEGTLALAAAPASQ